MRRAGKIVITLVLVLLLVLTFACTSAVTEEKEVTKEEEVVAKEEAITPTPTVKWGILEIRVTSSTPPADIASAVVHLANIEVQKVSDSESGWIPIPMSDNALSFNLKVTGVDTFLVSANITAGSFAQIRMDVIKVVGETTDKVSYTAGVPGEKLEIIGAFNIGDGKKTVLRLVFDGEKSLIRTDVGKFLFQPVVKLVIVYEKGKYKL